MQILGSEKAKSEDEPSLKVKDVQLQYFYKSVSFVQTSTLHLIKCPKNL